MSIAEPYPSLVSDEFMLANALQVLLKYLLERLFRISLDDISVTGNQGS